MLMPVYIYLTHLYISYIYLTIHYTRILLYTSLCLTSDSGYVWIERGHSVSHLTAAGHPFTIRDQYKREVFTVTLIGPADEL